ncbi:hypothetical protein CC2G_014351 [Coprinopsis cinerea AmutBmut pab1-1]|nr:hypothetical protein CC2G_014351 [Coprinopsis cinerea AmutBmut pab1-1]
MREPPCSLFATLNITEDDILVSFSIDGAQLERNKKSDCWIAVWIVQDYDPKLRFKKRRILPALICPGPDAPENIDSIVYRSFHHLSALQRENDRKGLKVWDGAKQAEVHSRILFWTNLADAVALPYMDGRVGHHGAKGCRLGCPMKGRHKSSGFYYAAHLCPNLCNIPGSNHPDTDFSTITLDPPSQYAIDLAKVESSQTQADFEKNRKETGLSKRSILSGLVHTHMPPVPRAFTVDLMHVLSLNMSDLMISLFTGRMRCEPTDSVADWPWAVLTGDTWVEHGILVEEAIQRTPSSFRRPPQNPEKKYNSGFKATQHEQYLYNLGPGFFRAVLPADYWEHYCKLVAAVRILSRPAISRKQLKDARRYAVEFVRDFELKYYQRRFDRMHFCRPVLHTLLHCAQEVERMGPGLLSTQYPMERSVNDYTQEIRLKSNIYGNLATITVKSAEINALHAICPDLDIPQAIPRGAQVLDKGYVLLRPRTPHAPYLKPGPLRDLFVEELNYKRVQKWGRIRLPNGQVLRSKYAEDNFTKRKPRITRMAKINLNGELEFAEVLFYFLHPVAHPSILFEKIYHPKAAVSFYSSRNQQIFEQSSKTLDVRTLSGNDIRIIDVYTLVASIAMQKLPKAPGDPDGLWFVSEKPALDDTSLMGFDDDMDEERTAGM